MHTQHFLIAGMGTIDLRQLSFWYWAFPCKPTNYEVCLYLSDTFAYRSADDNLLLTLHAIHKLIKMEI